LGALKGSMSFSKFYVQGRLPDAFAESFVERVRLRVFQPLTVDDEVEERCGWCSVEHPFDLELDSEKIFFNNYLNLGLRIDRWVVPGPLFKAHFAEAERVYLAKRGRAKLGKREKEELNVTVSRRLRKQIIPTMKVTDASWSLEHGIVRLWTQSPRTQQTFLDLFETTFDLQLMAEGPYASALRLGLTESEMSHFEQLLPTVFVAPLT